jgi:hypothetical protein
MMISQETIENDINNALDEVLPYQPYQPSQLDAMLVWEAYYEARARWNHLWDVLEGEDVTDGLERKFRARSFYKTTYPGASPGEDQSLLEAKGSEGIMLYPEILWKYGSKEVTAAEKFQGQYDYTARTAKEFCLEARMAQAPAERYLAAAYKFTDRLFEIRHISEDELLREPLLELGEQLALSLSPSEAPRLMQEWSAHLDQTIMKIDLIGEDGTVLEDMTAGLLDWAHQWFGERLGFRTLNSKESDRDILIGEDQLVFDLYGGSDGGGN